MDENQFYQICRRAVVRYFIQNQDVLLPEDCDLCLQFLSDIYFEYCKNKENYLC